MDLRLNLDLPLIRLPIVGRGDLVEHFLGRTTRGQDLFVGAVVGDAVAALCGADDRSSRFYNFRCGGHALDRLVEVLIEGITRVRRQDHVKGGIDGLHGIGLRPLACSGMFVEELPRERGRNFLSAVERDVHGEIDARHRRDLPNVIVNGVSFGDAPRCIGMSDAARVMEVEHRFQSRQTRCDHLGSTAESREEVRFDKTCRDLEVRFQPSPVQKHRDAVLCFSGVDQGRVVPGIVTDDAIIRRDFRPEHLDKFVPSVGPMGSRGYEERDVFGPDSGHFGKQCFQHQSPRLRPRDVADGNTDLLSRLNQFRKRWAGDRCANGVDQQLGGPGRPGPILRFDDGGALLGQFDLQTRRAVVQIQYQAPISN